MKIKDDDDDFFFFIGFCGDLIKVDYSDYLAK
jgi:hypothetical protein